MPYRSTIFNIIGPLTNPAGASRQLIGVFDPELCPKVAQVLDILGCERAMVVHGMNGLDEISTVGATRISQLQHLRDRLTGCIGCGCLSLTTCQLANPDDILGSEGPGARNL